MKKKQKKNLLKRTKGLLICNTLNRIRVYSSTATAPGDSEVGANRFWHGFKTPQGQQGWKHNNKPLTPMETSSSVDLGLKKPHVLRLFVFNALRCIARYTLSDAASIPGLGGGTCFLLEWRKKEKITQQTDGALSEDSARRLPDLDILTQRLADVNTLLEYVYTSGVETLHVL